MMGLGRNTKPRAKRAVQPTPLTTYAMGTFAGGNRSELANMAGFNYDAVSGTAGLEYSVNRNLIVGFAANATATRADINTGASVDVDALQAAAYASYATKNWFADALAAYGRHDLDLARPGVNDVIRGSTDASAVALAARGGYLFDFGRLRAGPIAGLTYIHSKVDGYTETGRPAAHPQRLRADGRCADRQRGRTLPGPVPVRRALLRALPQCHAGAQLRRQHADPVCKPDPGALAPVLSPVPASIPAPTARSTAA